jgi:hypothetical protein
MLDSGSMTMPIRADFIFGSLQRFQCPLYHLFWPRLAEISAMQGYYPDVVRVGWVGLVFLPVREIGGYVNYRPMISQALL